MTFDFNARRNIRNAVRAAGIGCLLAAGACAAAQDPGAKEDARRGEPGVGGMVRQIGKDAKAAGSGLWQGMKDTGKSIAGGAKEAASDIKTGARETGAGIASSAKSAGSAIKDGGGKAKDAVAGGKKAD